MCVSKHGLVNPDIRRLVWPILLNAEVISGKEVKEIKNDDSWGQYAKIKHRESG
jgi:hypothetical protein